jgi:uncharacterized protein YegP (UPF0339 family)
MTERLVVYRREDGLYDWRLVADNGQIIATSGGQGYTERNDAVEGAARVAKAFRETGVEMADD